MIDSMDVLDGKIAVLTLNRPKALNALNGPMLDALDAALDAALHDRKRAVVLQGSGRAFSAGADLKETHADPMDRVRRVHGLVCRLQQLPIITVAAVDGFALGGGLELAMACTFRVAGPNAMMGLPEIKMGMMPGFGGTQLLPRLVGAANALEIMLSGEPLDATAALRLGLVNAISATTADVLPAAIDLADRCSRHDGKAAQAIRTSVASGASLSLKEGLEVEHEQLLRLRSSRVPLG